MATEEVKWYGKELITRLRPLIAQLEKESAHIIERDAKRKCPVWRGEERKLMPGDKTWKARKRGALRDSIRAVRSKYRKGGWIVSAGNYDVFYAAFVELGTPGRGIPRDPFLRRPLNWEKRNFRKKVKDIFSGGAR